MGLEGLEELEFLVKGVFDGGEVGIEVRPGEIEGGEDVVVGLKLIEGLL